MLIETWIAALTLVFAFLLAIIGNFGWILEGQRYEKAVEENKQLIEENQRLRKVITRMGGMLNVKVADDFYNEGRKK